MDFFTQGSRKLHGRKIGGLMRNFVMTFWHTLTTPEEWHTASIIVVGVAMALTLGVLFGEAFDVQVLGM